MRRLISIIILLLCFVQPVQAMEFSAPLAPDNAEVYLPETNSSFWEDLLYIMKVAANRAQPDIMTAAENCLRIFVVVILVSLTQKITISRADITEAVGALMIGIILLKPTNTMIKLGLSTVDELTQYGKLLLPVMTAALAAQGGATTSAALYAGTTLFTSILSTLFTRILVPVLYTYLCLSVANCAIGERILAKTRDASKWLCSWSMKGILYIFSAYMSITGVVSGTADASAVKAAKLAISGTVPVIGKILSDASETILISAETMKNAAGIYGILVLIAVLVGPFVRIGAQYLLLKLTAALASIFSTKRTTELLEAFSSGMGFILAMTSLNCLFLLIGTVCFMKGVS